MTEILRQQNQRTFLAKFLLASPVGVSAGICQRTMADESGMIITQLGTHSRSENVPQYVGRFILYHPVKVTSNHLRGNRVSRLDTYKYVIKMSIRIYGLSLYQGAYNVVCVQTDILVDWLTD
jgi:hypothetical protein